MLLCHTAACVYISFSVTGCPAWAGPGAAATEPGTHKTQGLSPGAWAQHPAEAKIKHKLFT